MHLNNFSQNIWPNQSVYNALEDHSNQHFSNQHFIIDAIQDGIFDPIYGRKQKDPSHSSAVTMSAGAPVKTRITMPGQTHRHFMQQGYCCIGISDLTSGLTSPLKKEEYSWDQQLILSIWHSLLSLKAAPEMASNLEETSQASSPPPAKSSTKTPTQASPTEASPTEASPTEALYQWLQTTAQLSPQKRLEHFARDLLFSKLRDSPIAIFIDSLDTIKETPFALDTLLTWIWQCHCLLKNYQDYQPLCFVVLGTPVAFPAQPDFFENDTPVFPHCRLSELGAYDLEFSLGLDFAHPPYPIG